MNGLLQQVILMISYAGRNFYPDQLESLCIDELKQLQLLAEVTLEAAIEDGPDNDAQHRDGK